MPTNSKKIDICKACKKDFLIPSRGSFGYCPDCDEDMEKADLYFAIRNNIPKDWRIGQFVFNWLEWLGQKGYAPMTWSNRMADPFHLEDDKLINYWFEYLKKLDNN